MILEITHQSSGHLIKLSIFSIIHRSEKEGHHLEHKSTYLITNAIKMKDWTYFIYPKTNETPHPQKAVATPHRWRGTFLTKGRTSHRTTSIRGSYLASDDDDEYRSIKQKLPHVHPTPHDHNIQSETFITNYFLTFPSHDSTAAARSTNQQIYKHAWGKLLRLNIYPF